MCRLFFNWSILKFSKNKIKLNKENSHFKTSQKLNESGSSTVWEKTISFRTVKSTIWQTPVSLSGSTFSARTQLAAPQSFSAVQSQTCARAACPRLRTSAHLFKFSTLLLEFYCPRYRALSLIE